MLARRVLVALVAQHRERRDQLPARETRHDDAAVLLIGAGQESGHIFENQERDVEGIAEPHEARALSRCIDVENAGQKRRLVCHDANGVTIEAYEADDEIAREMLMDLE